MTLDRVKEIRRAEAEAAGQVLGATMHFLDQGDYPLPDNQELVLRLADLMRELQPGVILTHSKVDPYNYDHPLAADLTLRARMVAQAQGRPSAHPVIGAPPVFRFEPHQPEMCEFRPDVLVNITPVFDLKQQAMAAMGSQEHLVRYYEDLAERRAVQARRNGGPRHDPLRGGLSAGLSPGERGAGVKPVVIVDPPRADAAVVAELGDLGVATVHEAAGKTGLLGTALRPAWAGARAAGTALTVLCGPGDNLMLHVAIEQARPGDLLVVTTTSPSSDGFVGELITTSLAAREVRGW